MKKTALILLCMSTVLLAAQSPRPDIDPWLEDMRSDRMMRALKCDPYRLAQLQARDAAGIRTPRIDPLRPLYHTSEDEPEAGITDREADEAASPKWISLGPLGGEVKGLAVNPKKSSEMFLLVSSSYSGLSLVYRSTNTGGKWKKTSSINRNGYDIAVDPKNPKIVYVLGYQELYKSKDSGKTWEEIRLNPAYNYDRRCDWGQIAIHPGSTQTIWLSGSFRTSSNPWRTCMAVHKTTNGGKTWTTAKLQPGSHYGYGRSLVMAPSQPNTLYFGGYRYTGSSYDYHVFRTTNGGGSWQDVSGPVNSQPQDIAVDPTNPNRAWVATYSGIWRTTNGGGAWQKNSGYVYAYGITVDPKNTNRLYAGYYKNCHVSTDGGVHWTEYTKNIYGSCTLIKMAGSKIFYGSSAGLAASTNQVRPGSPHTRGSVASRSAPSGPPARPEACFTRKASATACLKAPRTARISRGFRNSTAARTSPASRSIPPTRTSSSSWRAAEGPTTFTGL